MADSNGAELAIIVPTRGRPENVIKVIQAWTDTGAWSVATLVLAVDIDDPQYTEYRDLYERSCPTYPGLQMVVLPKWEPMVYKLDRWAVRLAETRLYTALGFAGDDHLPRTGGWASRYLGELRRLETGIVYGDDGCHGGKLPTEWAMTSNIVRELGRMVPAPVEHLYCDNSILDLGRAAGCIRYLSDVVIEHMHPYAGGKGRMDAQYKRINSRQQYAKDRAIYRNWQRSGVQDQVAKVKVLMTGYKIKAGAQPGGEVVTQPSTNRVRQRPSTIVPWPASNRDRKVQPVNKLSIPRRLFKIQSGSPPNIMVALADMASQVPADQAIVELGVFRGATAIMMGWAAQQGAGAHVWGIDAWDLPGNTYAPPFTDPGSRTWAHYNVKAQGLVNHITLIHGFSQDQAHQWSGPPIGLLFVDADHSYEGARGDLIAWAPHLADGAVLAFDDYDHPDWPGVRQAVDELVSIQVLEPIQIFHDRLAVTKLTPGAQDEARAGTWGQVQGQVVQGKWVLDPDSKPIDLGDSHYHDLGSTRTVQVIDDATVTAVTGEGAAVRIEHEHPGTGQVSEGSTAVLDDTSPQAAGESVRRIVPTESSVLQPFPREGRPVQAAGKAETVPMGRAHGSATIPAPGELDPNVATGREIVEAGEIPSVPVRTTLDQLNVAQLRELAQVRRIVLGRDRKNREAALAALRAGR